MHHETHALKTSNLGRDGSKYFPMEIKYIQETLFPGEISLYSIKFCQYAKKLLFVTQEMAKIPMP